MKKLLTVAWFILASFHLSFGAAISGTQVNDTIVPTDTTDEYPTHDDQYGRSHWLLVANAAERTSLVEPAGISELRRTLGMIVFQLDTGNVWRLTGFPNTWTDLGVFNATAATANIYTQDGTLLANRTITGAGKTLTFSGLADWSVTGTATSTVQGLNLYLNGTSTVNINQSGNHFRFPFIAAALASDDTLLLQNPTTKDVKRSTVTLAQTLAQTNIFNTTGTLTGARSLLGGGYDFTIQNVNTLTQNASTLTQGAGTVTVASTGNATVSAVTNLSLSGTEVRLNNSGSKYIFKNTPTTAASTDEILGIDVASGEVRHAASATIANIAAASTFYNSSGALSGNRTVTGGGYNLSFSGIGNAVRASTTVSEAATTTASYSAADLTITGVNSISFNTPNVELSAAEIGQYLRLGNTSGSVEFATAFYTGIATQSGAAYSVANTDLLPDYDSATQHAVGTIAYVTLNAASVGSDTLKLGPSTDALGIVHQDGTVIEANELSANYPYTFVKVGTGGSGKWVLQGGTSTTSYDPASRRTITVEDVATLVALDPTKYQEAFTRGYYNANDGGGGRYYWRNSTTSTNTGTKIASAVSGSWNLVHNGTVLFNQFGVRQDGSAGYANENAAAMNAAITAFASGGKLVLPESPNLTYVGPDQIIPATSVNNLTIEINGDIKRPSSATVPAGDQQSFMHFTAGTTNNLHIKGFGTIWGNSTGQTYTNHYGKENGIRIDNSQNSTIEGVTIRDFGYFAIFVGNSYNFKARGLTLVQTNGNNDTVAWGRNCDGLHVYQSSEVLIDNCRIASTDDCIAITGLDGYTSTNIVIANCVLSPYAAHPTYVNHGIRIGPDNGGYSTMNISDVKVTDTIIDCHASSGIIVGINSASPRFVHGVTLDNVQINNAFVGNIQIGPETGNAPTETLSGAVNLLNTDDVTLSNVRVNMAKSAGVNIANVRSVTWNGGSISNVVTGTSTNWPNGTGIAVWQDLYGDTDSVNVSNLEIDKVHGGGILGTGTTYILHNLQVSDTKVTRWNQSLGVARTYGAFGSQNSKTNVLDNVTAEYGEGCPVVFYPKRAADETVVRNSRFGDLGTTVTTPSAFIEYYSASTTPWGTLDVQNNKFGKWRAGTGMFRITNPLNLRVLHNIATAASFASSVDSYAISVFMAATSGSPNIVLSGNSWDIPTANGPSTILGILSGGSTASTPVLHIQGDNITSGDFIPALSTGFTVTQDRRWNNSKFRTSAGAASVNYVDGVLNITAAGTVTLPNAIYVPGKSYTVKRNTGGAVSVASTSAQTFDGIASPYVLVSCATFTSDGANWIVTAAF